MLIHFERTGGLAGLHTAVTLNTDTLPQEEAQRLKDMVDTSNFFNLPEKFPVPTRGADYFVYRLTVEKDGKKHTVEVSDPEVSASLRPLIQSLSKYARK